ncbi:MAG: class I SAM-dependent methyltransferase [Bacteroidota bacterium]
MSVLLKGQFFEGISQKELVTQLVGKKKAREKLPTWFNTPNIYYPGKINFEQTSSEQTGRYKATLVCGKDLIDITGGFGVDSYFFSKRMDRVVHCEIDAQLSEIAAHNAKALSCANIKSVARDGIRFLTECNNQFDWAYADPSRRNDVKGRVFRLSDCYPDITEHLNSIFGKTAQLLLKTSPLLDIKQGILTLQSVKEIHVVALKNEVKELLWVLKKGYSGDIKIKTINLKDTGNEVFDFQLNDEKNTPLAVGLPKEYLYEPNAAILKAGAFKTIGKHFGVTKLHVHSHLYTATALINFPGRRFKIKHIVAYQKRLFQKLGIDTANITTRNFSETVATIRKKLKIREGGETYLFFTTTNEKKRVIIVCEKIH